MTGTLFILILVLTIIIISLTIDGYKKFILKKEKIKTNYWYMIIFPMIYYILLWDGNYFASIAEIQREKYNIPPIEKTMRLRYRSRFKEKWINSDTLKIQHKSKIINLGQSIEKETDFFTNEKENKTLRIKSTFPIFSSKPKKEYALLNGIIIENRFFEPMIQVTIFSKKQKDSVLTEWKLIK